MASVLANSSSSWTCFFFSAVDKHQGPRQRFLLSLLGWGVRPPPRLLARRFPRNSPADPVAALGALSEMSRSLLFEYIVQVVQDNNQTPPGTRVSIPHETFDVVSSLSSFCPVRPPSRFRIIPCSRAAGISIIRGDVCPPPSLDSAAKRSSAASRSYVVSPDTRGAFLPVRFSSLPHYRVSVKHSRPPPVT